jgi:hypothetical protein
MTPPIRSIIKHHAVRVDVADAPAAPALPKNRAPRAGQKHVELLRLEGKVQALEITCSCGEKTVVELEYADDKTPEKK